MSAAIFALTLIATVGVSRLGASSYEATAQILLQQPDQVNAVLNPDAITSAANVQREVNTNAQLITSVPVIDAVRRQLRLTESVPDLVDRLSVTGEATSNLVEITARDGAPDRRRAHRDGRRRAVPGLPAPLGPGRDRVRDLRGRHPAARHGRRHAGIRRGRGARGASAPARDGRRGRDRRGPGRATGGDPLRARAAHHAAERGGRAGARAHARRTRGGAARADRPAAARRAGRGGRVRAAGDRAHPGGRAPGERGAAAGRGVRRARGPAQVRRREPARAGDHARGPGAPGARRRRHPPRGGAGGSDSRA